MINNWTRKIQIAEYPSSIITSKNKDIRKESPKYEKDIYITFFQLLISIAKSVLTRADVYTPITSAFARSYVTTIPFMLDDKDGYLAINYNNKDILRDFSKSTRHGEIAQGINYYLAKDIIGAYAIYDFKDYVNRVLGKKEKWVGRIPDYILCYPDGSVGILESKGIVCADPTFYIKSANEQCENGKRYVAAKNSYSSVVSFSSTSKRNKRYTKIHFGDPQESNYLLSTDVSKNHLYEYSKWFYLLDYEIATEKLRKGQCLNEEDLYTNKDTWNDNKGNRILDVWRLSENKSLEIGITQSLQYALFSRDFTDIKINKEISNDEEYFDDGFFLRLC